jgi:VRR-NUC domain
MSVNWTEEEFRDYQAAMGNAPRDVPKKKTRVKKIGPTEHSEQSAAVQTLLMMAGDRPALLMLYATPNGGKRHVITAKLMKDEGVRRGVPDLCLPVPRGGYVGLYVESKIEGGEVSPDQKWWLAALEAQGQCTRVCWSADEIVNTVLAYERGDILRPVPVAIPSPEILTCALMPAPLEIKLPKKKIKR